MLDWTRIVGFDWDTGNLRKSAEKHGVGQEEAERVFEDLSLMVVDDVAHSRSERRFQALGRTSEGRFLHVSFTLRADDTKIRVISARDMNRKERDIYDQEA